MSFLSRIEAASYEEAGYAIKENYKATMYHGSLVPVKDWHTDTDGAFGKGLYLTPDLGYADFYSKGGRMGQAGQKLATDAKYVYEFEIKGRAIIVKNIDEVIYDIQGSIEEAEDVDSDSAKIQRFFAQWATDVIGGDILVIPKKVKVEHVHFNAAPQALVFNKSAFKCLGLKTETKAR